MSGVFSCCSRINFHRADFPERPARAGVGHRRAVSGDYVRSSSFARFRRRYEKFQEQDARLSTTLQENLSGVRVVKAFARQDYEVNKFENENSQRYRLGLKLLMMHALYWPLSDIMAGAQMLGGYVLGALMVIDGTITLGTYLAYVSILIWIIEPMRGLGRIIVQASTGWSLTTAWPRSSARIASR